MNSNSSSKTSEPSWNVPVAQAATEEWCSMHILIEELSLVQRRLGTPLEEAEDFLRVRGLGSHIREKLDHLGPQTDGAGKF
jgi:hypothetical protein